MNNNMKKLILAAMFLAIGLILPSFTMRIPNIGKMLLLMHIPVLLCGFICGPFYGGIVGLVLPILNGALTGMPPLMPLGIAMAVELMFYGLVSGLFYNKLRNLRAGIFISLISAMVIGRIAFGVASFLLFKSLGRNFTLSIFFAQAVTGAIPGIIFQLIIIPAVITSLKRAKLEVE